MHSCKGCHSQILQTITPSKVAVAVAVSDVVAIAIAIAAVAAVAVIAVAIAAVAIDAVAAVVLTLQLSLLSNHCRSGLSLI